MWINDAGEAMKLLEPPRATTLLGMKDKKISFKCIYKFNILWDGKKSTSQMLNLTANIFESGPTCKVEYLRRYNIMYISYRETTLQFVSPFRAHQMS